MLRVGPFFHRYRTKMQSSQTGTSAKSLNRTGIFEVVFDDESARRRVRTSMGPVMPTSVMYPVPGRTVSSAVCTCVRAEHSGDAAVCIIAERAFRRWSFAKKSIIDADFRKVGVFKRVSSVRNGQARCSSRYTHCPSKVDDGGSACGRGLKRSCLYPGLPAEVCGADDAVAFIDIIVKFAAAVGVVSGGDDIHAAIEQGGLRRQVMLKRQPEEFSPFAMTTSMSLSALEGGESAAQKVAPVAAHHVADT